MSNTESKELQFLTINTASLWNEGKEEQGGGYNLDIGESLNIKSSNVYINTQRFSFPPPIKNPIDFAFDLCDILYILDGDTGQIMFYDLNTGLYDWIKCIKFTEPTQIGVGQNDIYVLDGNRIIFIAKTNYQTRRITENTGTNLERIATDSKGNLFLLNNNEKQIYKITKTGMKSIVFKDKIPVTADIIDICIGKDDTIYVLDSKNISLFTPDGQKKKDQISINSELVPTCLVVDEYHNIIVGNNIMNAHTSLYLYDINIEKKSLNYNKYCNWLLINQYGDLYVINKTDAEIIKFQSEIKYVRQAVYLSKQLDSQKLQQQWHKFVVERELPNNTSVDISYFASDNKVPPLEIPWIKVTPNPHDALMFDAIGRYLWFKIELYSHDGKYTPTVHSIRAYYPKQSYLRYLPAIYEEDDASKEFLERFLSIFQTLFTNIDDKIVSFTKYIDPKGTPDDFLPWLASWLVLEYDESWSNNNIRKFIEYAPRLYRMRGTRKGLEEIILIYLSKGTKLISSMTSLDNKINECEEKCGDIMNYETHQNYNEFKIMIFENFQLDCVKNDKEYTKLYCNDPYTFCILLDPFKVNEEQSHTIKKIVENEKPAHTVGNVILLQPWIYLGMHTYLGVNTKLNRQQFILGKSAVGRDSTIVTEDDSGQIYIRSRLGVDTSLS